MLTMRRAVSLFRSLPRLIAAISIAVGAVAVSGSAAAELLVSDDFEGGLERWRLEPPAQFETLAEPGTSNHVLQLTPKRQEFAQVILEGSDDYRDIRVEGRFLFPTDGDGFLGFLYNHRQTEERMDVGCLYVKSNGSYVRVSPHYDVNPSWRLHPEMQSDLEGEREIRTGVWYEFRLDISGAQAAPYLEDLTLPVVTYDMFSNESGAIGLEARPGGGEPVWVDDIRVSKLGRGLVIPTGDVKIPQPAEGVVRLLDWEILGPFEADGAEAGDGGGIAVDSLDPPDLPTEGWRSVEPDARGMVLTGRFTQYRSGDHEILFLRATFEVAEDSEVKPSWFAIAAANRIDIWLNGYYRGTVAPERFVWLDYLVSSENPGARLPISPQTGANELVLRVHGRRFAGGGFYAALTRSAR